MAGTSDDSGNREGKGDDEDGVTLDNGTVLRAKNGDVIRFEPSGLTLRLSDRVVEDIALRLGLRDGPVTEPEAQVDPPEGIDAWDTRRNGDWLCFTARLPGSQGVRGFRRHVSGGAVIADTPGPVLGILGLGGARVALANPGGAAFPQHILAPADDIGAVGHGGIETATPQDRFEPLREMTHEALVAETILQWRMEDTGPLPLFVTRAESDTSATSAELSCGKAAENLLIAAQNLRSGAAALGKRAKILAVALDFALEDHSRDASAYRDGMLATMEAVSAGLWAQGFDRPRFVTRFACARQDLAPQAALDGLWELSWSHGDHHLLISAPDYMFAHDAYDRPTEAARRQQAEMTACALSEPERWACPILHLAELEHDGTTLRVTARTEGGALVLDDSDPLGAGPAFGFHLTGVENGAAITGVTLDPADPQSLLIALSDAPKGAAPRLAYACAGAEAGALRDMWRYDSATGSRLHRWALPAHLPITGGCYG